MFAHLKSLSSVSLLMMHGKNKNAWLCLFSPTWSTSFLNRYISLIINLIDANVAKPSCVQICIVYHWELKVTFIVKAKGFE
jgi:hypothetical protein